MICSYTIKMAGPYHLANGIPCQDSFSVAHKGDLVVAAVGDGVGSEPHSEMGSSLATETAVRLCIRAIDSDSKTEEVINAIQDSFLAAYGAVCLAAEEDGNPVTQYDTTLCLAVWDGVRLVYGQSGDSGMIAALSDGHYIVVTEQQRDAEGCVFPLRFGPQYWRFESVTEPVASVLLATDGFLEALCHPLLRFGDRSINAALARLFLHRTELTADEHDEFERSAYEFLRAYPESDLDDDKTAVVLADPAHPPALLEDDYYAVPDWETLRTKAKEGFYPGLSSGEESDAKWNDDLKGKAEGETARKKPNQNLRDVRYSKNSRRARSQGRRKPTKRKPSKLARQTQ